MEAIENNSPQLPRSTVIARRLLRWIISLGFIYIIGSCGYWAYDNSDGVCKPLGRTLGDREFLYNALEHEWKNGKMEIASDNISLNVFLDSNPHCCGVYRPKGRLEILNRKEDGLGYATVSIQYKVATQALANGVDHILDYYDATIFLNTCGEVVEQTGNRLKKQHSRFHD